jgi:hypothetical protein
MAVDRPKQTPDEKSSPCASIGAKERCYRGNHARRQKSPRCSIFNHSGRAQMATLSVQGWIAIAVIVLAAVLALAIWQFYRKKQSVRLQTRFGTEYDRTVGALGNRSKAEAELKERELRVQKLNIVPLTSAEAARFTTEWSNLQGRFVDDPNGVVVQAGKLVRELMLKRGYPMGDFEHRAADISVDHPAVVENYRAAKAIAVRGESNQADTEELRKAVVHYRALFDELLETDNSEKRVLVIKELAIH